MAVRITKILASRQYNRVADKNLVPAAVLVLLAVKHGEHHVLFTKRSDKVKCHKGEISFPGGTVDPGDTDLLHTALREGKEEIGLMPHDVAILGRLDDMVTVTTGFVITPYVGIIPYPYPFQINAEEIAELFLAPLKTLAEGWRSKTSGISSTGIKNTGLTFYYQEKIIWGATARILNQFMDLVNDE